jgi:ssDNA-binding Zn-finger/Zn-ribbon topoisomerase 1
MLAKCSCQNCGSIIEFEAAEFEFSSETSHRRLGQFVECPHCHKQTQIYMNKSEFAAPKIPALKSTQPTSRLIPCDVCGNQISRSAFFCFQCGEFHYGLFRLEHSHESCSVFAHEKAEFLNEL